MRTINKIFLATAVSLTASAAIKAQTAKPINVVTSAVPFLRISPDARAGGMGETGLATDPDANTSFFNLAKTPFTKSNSGVGFTYSPWLRKLGLNDIYLATLTGYTKLDENQAVTGSLRYFNMGSINFTDNLGNDFGSMKSKEFSIDAGYSRKLSGNLSIAIALRYINSNLASGKTVGGATYKAGSAVAGDLSAFYNGQNEAGQGWNFGAALTNLGSKIGYTTDATQKDFIPANFGIGGAYTKVFDEDSRMTLAMDVNKMLVPTPPLTGDSIGMAEYRGKGVVGSWFSSFGDAPGGFAEELREFQLSGGLEYSYKNQFAVRAGYFHEDKSKGARQYFTLGAGLNYSMMGVNFSYIIPSGNGINENPLSNTLRFSVLLNFQ